MARLKALTVKNIRELQEGDLVRIVEKHVKKQNVGFYCGLRHGPFPTPVVTLSCSYPPNSSEEHYKYFVQDLQTKGSFFSYEILRSAKQGGVN